MFRIESYKTAVQNSATISTRIRERIEDLRGRTQDIEQKKDLLEKNHSQLKDLAASKALLDEKRAELLQRRKDVANEYKKQDRQRQDLEKGQEQLPLLHS